MLRFIADIRRTLISGCGLSSKGQTSVLWQSEAVPGMRRSGVDALPPGVLSRIGQGEMFVPLRIRPLAAISGNEVRLE